MMGRFYVPILKAKRGEFWALAKLDLGRREVVRPLLEPVPRKDGTVRSGELCGAVMDWGVPLYVDTHELGVSAAAATHARTVYDALADDDCLVIPTTGLARDPAYQSAIRDAVASHQSGVCLRLEPGDFNDLAQLPLLIESLLNILEVETGDADLLIDYGHFEQAGTLTQMIRANLADVPNIHGWNRLIVVAGAFPESINGHPNWTLLDRADWIGIRDAVIGAPPLPRTPDVGDYACRSTTLPPPVPRASTNIRYLTDDKWLVKQGTSEPALWSSNMEQLAQELIARPEYEASLSAGDDEYAARAATTGRYGGTTQWAAWAVSRHVSKAADQVASLL